MEGLVSKVTHTMRNAQITVLLIIIVVLLIIGGLGMFIASEITQKKGEQEIITQQLSNEKLDPIREYFTSCLDVSAKHAIESMGLQGGYLFQSQGGPIRDFRDREFGDKFLNLDTTRVAYAIFEPKGNLGALSSTVPIYPWDTFPEILELDGNIRKEKHLSGFFGINRLPPLNNSFKNSVQEQLENFTQTNFFECLELEKLEVQNLAFNTGEALVNVTLGKHDVFFALTFPVEIIDKSTMGRGVMDTFSVKYNVRLKKFFEIMELITDKDVGDLDFDVTGTYEDNISTVVQRNVHNKDDVIFIKDPKSKILNKEFEFRFARHNRAPALFKIMSEKNKKEFPLENFVLCGALSDDGNFKGAVIGIDENHLVLQNAISFCTSPSLKIPLEALDPDEDNVSFILEIDEQELISRELTRDEMVQFQNIGFPFKVKAQDGILEDFEELTFNTEIITPK